ncbi:nitrate reductase molybdenum cofactor assembly chaperone [Nocardia sp. NPDC060249]|uniref:nitrate reductase molybdenum cofactor assembly chaperone n=1 Tax=Nocardia sp. NPDC060249 TaxID=3347082 RepID=UPI003666D802
MRARAARRAAEQRLVWQAASLLLAYPDSELRTRLELVTRLCAHLPRAQAEPLLRVVADLGELPEVVAAQQFTQTFDLRRRATLLLTYWTDGDTRNRGMAMLAFTEAYRGAGVRPPTGEVADHLPVVLEFAATVDPVAGAALLTAYRRAIHAIGLALSDEGSRYAPVLAAVVATLPPATEQDLGWARRLVEVGPAAESVGLAPFTLTVPPRRSAHEREPAVVKGLR